MREGWLFISIFGVLTLISIWIATRWDNWLIFGISLIFGILTLFMVFFFRDPERAVPVEPCLLVAPADGKIVSIETLESHPFIEGKVINVSIFLSVLDVHVNRVPATGTVDYVNYIPGMFFPAFQDKASQRNERNEIGITTDCGRKIVCKQIAGILARRVVCYLKPGDTVEVGRRFGMIKFGSRTELLVPADSRLLVSKGDRVLGGKTIIGYLSSGLIEDSNAVATEGNHAEL